MKKSLLASAVFASMCAFCGANEYNMSLGSFSLTNAAGCSWNIALGAASMMGSENVSRSTFVGNRAGQQSNSSSNVVGIGWNAGRNVGGTTRATDINGQFKANETADTIQLFSKASDEPRLSYHDGTWTVNGDLRIAGSVSISNTVSFVPSGTPVGYDLYVDALYGDDENDGLSAITAKQTIDAALALVDTNGMSVCVRAGVYDYPTFFKTRMYTGAGSTVATPYTPYLVNLFAVDGAERTVISNSDTNEPAWVAGYTNGMMTVSGFTFRGFSGPPHGYGSGISTFNFIHFKDCVFEDTSARVRMFYNGQIAVFDECILEGCVVRRCVFSSPRSVSLLLYNCNVVFSMCLAYRCVVEYDAPEVMTDDNWAACFSVATEWRDSYARMPKTRIAPRRTWNGQNSNFSDGRVYNSTMVIGQVTESASGHATSWFDSIVGYTSSAAVANHLTDCYTNTASDVLALLGADLKPTPGAVRLNPILGCCGYGQSQSIAMKNAIVSYVGQAIRDSIPSWAAEGVRNALLAAATSVDSYAAQEVPERPDIESLRRSAVYVLKDAEAEETED